MNSNIKIKPINKKTIVVFEVGDEPKYYGSHSLSEQFKDFIKSLGFNIENKFPCSSDIEHIFIDGVEVDISYKKLLYLLKMLGIKSGSQEKTGVLRWLVLFMVLLNI